MKKRKLVLALIVVLAVLLFTFTACIDNSKPNNPNKPNVPDQSIVEIEGVGNATIDETKQTIDIDVENNVLSFELSKIKVEEGVSVTIYKNADKTDKVEGENIPLVVGENVFYLHLQKEGYDKVWTVTIDKADVPSEDRVESAKILDVKVVYTQSDKAVTGKLEIVDNGETRVVEFTPEMVPDFVAGKVGEQIVTLNYKGYAEKFRVKVLATEFSDKDLTELGTVTIERINKYFARYMAIANTGETSGPIFDEYFDFVLANIDSFSTPTMWSFFQAAGFSDADVDRIEIHSDKIMSHVMKIINLANDAPSTVDFVKKAFTEERIELILKDTKGLINELSAKEFGAMLYNLGAIYNDKIMNFGAGAEEIIEKYKDTEYYDILKKQLVLLNNYDLFKEVPFDVYVQTAEVFMGTLLNLTDIPAKDIADTIQFAYGLATSNNITEAINGVSPKEMIGYVKIGGKLINAIADSFSGKSIAVQQVYKTMFNFFNGPIFIMDVIKNSIGAGEYLGALATIVNSITEDDYATLLFSTQEFAVSMGTVDYPEKMGRFMVDVSSILSRIYNENMDYLDRYGLEQIFYVYASIQQIDKDKYSEILSLFAKWAKFDSKTMTKEQAVSVHDDVIGFINSISERNGLHISTQEEVMFIKKGITQDEFVTLFNEKIYVSFVENGEYTNLTFSDLTFDGLDFNTLGLHEVKVSYNGYTATIKYYLYDDESIRKIAEFDWTKEYAMQNLDNIIVEKKGEEEIIHCSINIYGTIVFRDKDVNKSINISIDVYESTLSLIRNKNEVLGKNDGLFKIELPLVGEIYMPCVYYYLDAENPILTDITLEKDDYCVITDYDEVVKPLLVANGFDENYLATSFYIRKEYNKGLSNVERIDVDIKDIQGITVTHGYMCEVSYEYEGKTYYTPIQGMTFEQYRVIDYINAYCWESVQVGEDITQYVFYNTNPFSESTDKNLVSKVLGYKVEIEGDTSTAGEKEGKVIITDVKTGKKYIATFGYTVYE